MFQVPEAARIRSGPLGTSALDDGDNGAFVIDSATPGWVLCIVATDGTVLDDDDPRWALWQDWEHVTVRAATQDGEHLRTPSWAEMCQVKALFWDPEDVVMQLHRPDGNGDDHVLQLWRHRRLAMPDPPVDLRAVHLPQ